MINIFFGSSILRETEEKEQIEVFIRKITKEFKEVKEKVDITIRPLFKNELNTLQTLIDDAEYSFFIIFKLITDNEFNEIDYAVKYFEEHNRPKVYVYFKNIIEDNIDQSVNELKNKVANEFSHYYHSFYDINEIKLRLIENVFSDKLKNSLVLEDQVLKFEGIDISKYIDYKKIPEFSNNEELIALNREYVLVNEEYQKLAKENNDDFFGLQEYYAKKEVIREKIKELEQRILNLSISLIEMKNQDLKSETISKALLLFEKGKINECIEMLQLSKSRDLVKEAYELKSKSKLDKDKAEYNIKWSIRENKIIINLLQISENYNKKQELLEALYEKNARMAIDFEIEFDEVFEYIDYCIYQGYIDKADEYIDLIRDIVEEKSERKYPLLYAKLYNVLARLSSLNDDYNETIELYDESIEYYKMAEKVVDNKEEYLYGLFNNNYEIAKLLSAYTIKTIYDESEKYFVNALDVCKELVEINFMKYSELMSRVYISYLDQSYYKFDVEIINFFKKMGQLIKDNLDTKSPKDIIKLGDCYFALGYTADLYDPSVKHENFEKALKYYNMIKLDDFIEVKSKIANTYFHIGSDYRMKYNFDLSNEYLLKSKELYKEILRLNPKYYEDYIKVNGIIISNYAASSPIKLESSIDEFISEMNIISDKKDGKMLDALLLFYSQIAVTILSSGGKKLSEKLINEFEEIYNTLDLEEFNVNSKNFMVAIFYYFDYLLCTSDDPIKVQEPFDLFVELIKEAFKTRSINCAIASQLLPTLINELMTYESAQYELPLNGLLDLEYYANRIRELDEMVLEDEDMKKFLEENPNYIEDNTPENFSALSDIANTDSLLQQCMTCSDELSDEEKIQEITEDVKILLEQLNNYLMLGTNDVLLYPANNTLLSAISDLYFEYDAIDDEIISLLKKYLDLQLQTYNEGLIVVTTLTCIAQRILCLVMILSDCDEQFMEYLDPALEIIGYIEENVSNDGLENLMALYGLCVDIYDNKDDEENTILFKYKYVCTFNRGFGHQDLSEKFKDYIEYLDDLFDYYLDEKEDEILQTLYEGFEYNVNNQLIEYIDEYTYKEFSWVCDSVCEYLSEIDKEVAAQYAILSDYIRESFESLEDEEDEESEE